MRARMRLTWVLSALLATGACTPTTFPSASEAPSAAPSPSSAPAGNLPPGCVSIALQAPTGERIELGGPWTEVTTGGQPMTWWIRTAGDCIWGTGHVADISEEGAFEAAPHQVQSFNGHIGPDFVITGEIVNLGPLPDFVQVDDIVWASLEMLIEFDDAGAITLREDREPGVSGPRCPAPGGYCPDPLVLQPAD